MNSSGDAGLRDDAEDATSSGDAGLRDDAADTGLPQCSWPPVLDPADAMAGECKAAHALLECVGAGGSTILCLSDGVERCSGLDSTPHGDCDNLCDPEEYGLACGRVGPGPREEAPATCRLAMPIPGFSFYCCPCGS